MQTATSSKRNIKSKIGAWAIGLILAIILYNVIFEGAIGKQGSVDISQEAASALYTEELKRASNEYRQCLQETEYGPSRAQDPMAGTQLSEENLDRSAREDCSRKYETRMRIIKAKYE